MRQGRTWQRLCLQGREDDGTNLPVHIVHRRLLPRELPLCHGEAGARQACDAAKHHEGKDPTTCDAEPCSDLEIQRRAMISMDRGDGRRLRGVQSQERKQRDSGRGGYDIYRKATHLLSSGFGHPGDQRRHTGPSRCCTQCTGLGEHSSIGCCGIHPSAHCLSCLRSPHK